MKKFIFSMICTLFPILALAQQEPYAVLSENNTKLTFYYDDQKATRGGMDVGPFTDSDQRGWYEQRDNIEQVAFDESFANCTTITSTRYWFCKLTKLTTITDINNLNTDNVTDMGYMFWGCSSLTSLDVSNFNTSNVTNMSLMFAACENLASLELGDNFNTSNVTDMSSIFGACESLTSIDVSNFNTANVTNMGSMFSDCSSLTSLDVTGFNTSKATYMESMFWGCSSLTTLDVTHFDTSNATDLGGMFNGCSSLTSLDVSGFDTSKATNMEIMFGACESLTSLDLSNFNTSNVTQMWKMFSGCSNLAKLDVTGFETSNTTIMTAMFEGCSNLTNLDLRSFNTSNATTMHQMFYHCSGLETIYVGNEWSTEKIGQDATGEGMFTGCTALVGGAGTTYDENHVDYTYAHIDGGTSNPGYFSGPGQAIPYAVLSENNTVLTFYSDDQKATRGGMGVGPFADSDPRGWNDARESIISIVFDESFANCTTITSTSYWFAGFQQLTTITDLENLKTDNVTEMREMFSGCSALTSLDLSGFDTSKVTDMSRMFSGCKSLTSLDVSGFNTQNVTNMSFMFAGCKSLTSLDVSGFDTSNVTDMSDMFAELKGEQISLDLSGFNTSNVTTMKEMFVESSSLMSINLSNFDTSNVTSMEDMFAECQALTSLDISSFNTSNVTNMKGLFRGNPALTAIYAGSEWNTASVTDGEDMFSECTALVGGAGTTYDTNHVDYTYAHIDGGSSNPGYFTASDGSSEASEETWAELHDAVDRGDKLLTEAREAGTVEQWALEELENMTVKGSLMYEEHTAGEEEVRHMTEELNHIIWEVEEMMHHGGEAEPYAVLSENNTVLTFYYDNEKEARGGWDVRSLHWFDDSESITSVVFDESFANCTTITSTANWFTQCENLATITGLEYLKTDNVTDMWSMFGGCSSLTSLDLSGFNTENVTNMGHMFRDCSALTSLELSGFNTENVTDMSAMFESCSGLTSLDLSGFNTENVTDMGGMFVGCSSLTSLDFSGFNTENVTYMGAMFESCSGLTSLDLSGFNTENVTDMGGMFVGCSSLTSLDFSGFNTENVTYMGAMFESCSGLTSLDLSGFNTENVTDMGGMFRNCSALTSLELSGFNTENVTDMRLMFESCSNLTSLDLSGFNTYNVTDMGSMFSFCSGLTSLDLSGFNTENVTNMSTMFYGCESLTSLDLSGFNTYHVTDMSNLFMFCSGLTTIYAGEGWSTDNISAESGDNMFTGCIELVGGAGTKYDLNHIDHTYAHIDGGKSNPGYLTDINGGGEAYFNDYTAYVYGNATLDDAFAEVGRETAIQTIAAIVWEGNDALTADMLSGIDNPNLLVFVNEASKAPAGVQNVVVNGVAEEIILTDASGNNNFYCPQSFMARSINYSRDFSQTTEIEECRGWETIALPFDVQSITHETHGALVPFGGENDGYPFWLRQLSDNGLARATQIEANKPYLISMPNSIIYPAEYNQNGTVTFSSSNVTVPETSAQSDSYAGVTLTAAFQQVAQGNNIYALNVGEARGEYPEGSVFEQNYRDIRPFQAYTTHTAGARGFISLESLGGGNDDTTGIENFRIKNSELRDSDGFWYSLDGRRLNAKPTKKGVYVKDGRKIVIK